MKQQLNQGFVLAMAVWFVAILSLLGFSMVSSYLVNTQATQSELQRIHAELLLDAGLRFAVLGIASPRIDVAATAIPQDKMVYRSNRADVTISIENEAGFVDLLLANSELKSKLFSVSGMSVLDASKVLKVIAALSSGERKPSYRYLDEQFSNSPGLFQRLLTYATLYNGQSGVHPQLASEQVLALLSDLSKVDRDRLISERTTPRRSLVSTPVHSEFFSNTVSAYYRITTQTVISGVVYSRKQIIKMINQPDQLFEIIATF